MKPTEMQGQKFGRLEVISRAANRRSQAYWLCACSCGGSVECRGADLRYGRTNSCGCLRRKSLFKGDYIGRIFHSYSKDAQKRGISFSISREEFEELIFLSCHYCGQSPNQKVRVGRRFDKWHPTFRYNGVDRADNTKGYEPGNTLPCCGRCNKAKSVMGYEEFLDWAALISSRHPRSLGRGAA